MPTLLLHFPARRYHATPFGHHVNEGVIEWPPSPWRLLRALLSVGYCKLGWPAAMDDPQLSTPPDLARSLICKLAGALPTYSLPPAVGAHTRHYMPVGKFDGGRERTTLVFDTWAQIERGDLGITWHVSLLPGESQLLGELVAGLDYLGRSESWVTARLIDGDSARAHVTNCFPCADNASPGPGWEQVAVMAPQPSPAYAAWSATQSVALLSDLPEIALPAKAKLTAKDRKPSEQREAARRQAIAPYPADLLACLQADSMWLREHGWSQPPGSRRVMYWRRDDALNAPAVSQAGTLIGAPTVPFVLLCLTTTSGNNHALPTLSRSLPQGEMLHRQMVGARFRLAPGAHSRVITGCDESGQNLRGAHGHAHVLSLDLDADGHIDHLLVWAPDGLDARDQQALRHTRGTYTKGGVGALRLVFAAAGGREELRGLPRPFGEALSLTTGRAREWVSGTPFVPPRHLKARGVNNLEGQVRAELASRGFPSPSVVQWFDPQHSEHARRLRRYVRVRRNGLAPPMDAGFTLRLVFDEAVQGPLCLGYGSHFGLGRFEHLADTVH